MADADRCRRCRVLGMEEPGPQCDAGQKGTRICTPIVGDRRKKDEVASKDITRQNKPVLLGLPGELLQ